MLAWLLLLLLVVLLAVVAMPPPMLLLLLLLRPATEPARALAGSVPAPHCGPVVSAPPTARQKLPNRPIQQRVPALASKHCRRRHRRWHSRSRLGWRRRSKSLGLRRMRKAHIEPTLES